MQRTLLSVAVTFALTACFSPTIQSGVQCSADGECPDDLECAWDNRCYSADDMPSPEADAAVPDADLGAACGNGVGSNGASKIDARVDATLDEMYREFPNTVTLSEKATGMLIMPLVTKVGFGIGGGFGRGVLQVDGVTVDYYSTTKQSFRCLGHPCIYS